MQTSSKHIRHQLNQNHKIVLISRDNLWCVIMSFDSDIGTEIDMTGANTYEMFCLWDVHI